LLERNAASANDDRFDHADHIVVHTFTPVRTRRHKLLAALPVFILIALVTGDAATTLPLQYPVHRKKLVTSCHKARTCPIRNF
jgi:hypothetical protein